MPSLRSRGKGVEWNGSQKENEDRVSFLDFAMELRIMVLDEVLTIHKAIVLQDSGAYINSTNDTVLCHESLHWYPRVSLPPAKNAVELAILRTCKQLHAEGNERLYKQNTFTVYNQGRKLAPLRWDENSTGVCDATRILTHQLRVPNLKLLSEVTLHLGLPDRDPFSAKGKRKFRFLIPDCHRLLVLAPQLKKLQLVIRTGWNSYDIPTSLRHRFKRVLQVPEDEHIATLAKWLRKDIPALTRHIPSQLSILLFPKEPEWDDCPCAMCSRRASLPAYAAWDPDIITKAMRKASEER